MPPAGAIAGLTIVFTGVLVLAIGSTLSITEYMNLPFPQDNLLIIGGGSDNNNVLRVDLNVKNLTCETIPEFPVPLTSPISVKLNRQPLLCDTDEDAAAASSGNKCWLLRDFKTWELLPATMNRTRGTGARGVQMPEEDQFWIVGGSPTADTEIYSGKDNLFYAGPDLPRAANDSCLVQVNSTHYFLAGGRTTTTASSEDEDEDDGKDEVKLAAVSLYSPVTGLWKEMPAMPRERSGHLCGVKGHKVYVFGGGDEATWVFNLETAEWSSGISMPVWQTATASVQFNGTFVVLDMKPSKKSSTGAYYTYVSATLGWLPSPFQAEDVAYNSPGVITVGKETIKCEED